MAVRVSLSRGHCAGRLRTLGSRYHFLVVFVLVVVWVTEPCCAHFAAIVWLAAGSGFCYLFDEEGRYGCVCRCVDKEGRREGTEDRREKGREGMEGWREEGKEGLFKWQIHQGKDRMKRRNIKLRTKVSRQMKYGQLGLFGTMQG